MTICRRSFLAGAAASSDALVGGSFAKAGSRPLPLITMPD